MSSYTLGQDLGNGFTVDYPEPLLMAGKWVGNTYISIEEVAKGSFELKWNIKKQEFSETFATLEEALKRGSEIL